MDLDLSFIQLTGKQKILVTGLPKGLRFNPLTKDITGKISFTTKLQLSETVLPVQIRVMDGSSMVSSISFTMTLSPYQFLGKSVALLENSDGTPAGQFTLLITTPGSYSATLALTGESVRKAKGSIAELPGVTRRNLGIAFPASKTSAATTVNVTLLPSDDSDAISGDRDSTANTLRGFRLPKPASAPLLKRFITIALTNTIEGDGVSIPAGTGVLTGTVDSKGVVKVSGFTGDAQKFTSSFDLSQGSQGIIWAQPYKNKNGYLAGIVNIIDLGLPALSNNTSTPPLDDGIFWLKAADSKEKSYPLGFPLLALIPEVSQWVPPASSSDLSTSLGLSKNEIGVSYLNPLAVQNLPELFQLDSKFALITAAPAASVPWKGTANKTNGSFTGKLTLPTGSGTANGIFVKDSRFGSRVGTGLIQIPLVSPKGSFQTIDIKLNN